MRLGTCIALELAFAAGAAGGLVLGVGHAIDRAGDYFAAHEAAAATTRGTPPTALVPLPAERLTIAAPAAARTVFDTPDDVLLAPLGASPVTQVKLNHGGTSLSLRLDFESGARAAFKPQQVHPQSDPRREIAAYRIDRLLGIGHVPPARPFAVPVAQLVAAAEPAYHDYVEGRIRDEAIAHDGILRGELSWWIPDIRDIKIGPYRIDEKAGMEQWASYLQVGATIPPELRPMLEQIATCVLFDVLIDNSDRWTGNNTKGSPDQRTLYFMDNTLAFSQFTYGHQANLVPLYRIQVFPRALVARLRALTYEQLAAVLDLDEDPAGLAPLLEPAEIHAILGRRDHMLQYIDSQIAQFGEQAVLSLP